MKAAALPRRPRGTRPSKRGPWEHLRRGSERVSGATTTSMYTLHERKTRSQETREPSVRQGEDSQDKPPTRNLLENAFGEIIPLSGTSGVVPELHPIQGNNPRTRSRGGFVPAFLCPNTTGAKRGFASRPIHPPALRVLGVCNHVLLIE